MDRLDYRCFLAPTRESSREFAPSRGEQTRWSLVSNIADRLVQHNLLHGGLLFRYITSSQFTLVSYRKVLCLAVTGAASWYLHAIVEHQTLQSLTFNTSSLIYTRLDLSVKSFVLIEYMQLDPSQILSTCGLTFSECANTPAVNISCLSNYSQYANGVQSACKKSDKLGDPLVAMYVVVIFLFVCC